MYPHTWFSVSQGRMVECDKCGKTIFHGDPAEKENDCPMECSQDEFIEQKVENIITSLIQQRKKLGWTQEELAKRSGLKQSYIARVENCKTMPLVTSIHRIADALGLSLTLEPCEKK